MRESWDQSTMGRRMKAAAVQAGLTQGEVARRLGVQQATVSRWWSGARDPPSGTLLAYARLVGKPAGYFFGQEEEDERVAELSALLLQSLQRLLAGEKSMTALDRVIGEQAALTAAGRPPLAETATHYGGDSTGGRGRLGASD